MLQRSARLGLRSGNGQWVDRVGVGAVAGRAGLLQAQTECVAGRGVYQTVRFKRGAQQLVYYQPQNYGQTARRSQECARFV